MTFSALSNLQKAGLRPAQMAMFKEAVIFSEISDDDPYLDFCTFVAKGASLSRLFSATVGLYLLEEIPKSSLYDKNEKGFCLRNIRQLSSKKDLKDLIQRDFNGVNLTKISFVTEEDPICREINKEILLEVFADNPLVLAVFHQTARTLHIASLLEAAVSKAYVALMEGKEPDEILKNHHVESLPLIASYSEVVYHPKFNGFEMTVFPQRNSTSISYLGKGSICKGAEKNASPVGSFRISFMYIVTNDIALKIFQPTFQLF